MAQLKNPHITIYQKAHKNNHSINDKMDWTISASHGKVDFDSNKIKLIKQVSIIQHNNNFSLATDNIDFWPGELYGETDSPVKIKTSNTILSSHGLKLDLKNQHYQLLSYYKQCLYELTSYMWY